MKISPRKILQAEKNNVFPICPCLNLVDRSGRLKIVQDGSFIVHDCSGQAQRVNAELRGCRECHYLSGEHFVVAVMLQEFELQLNKFDNPNHPDAPDSKKYNIDSLDYLDKMINSIKRYNDNFDSKFLLNYF